MATEEIESIFPQDPSLGSLVYIAASNLPITIPWMRKQISLGTGFKTAHAETADPFYTRNAFEAASLADASITFVSAEGAGSHLESTTSTAGRSAEHVGGSASVTVGCRFLGASGAGTYTKDILKNKDANKSSIRTNVRAGTILFSPPPALSSHALSLLRARYTDGSDPITVFNGQFGDYYVAGMRLGADNATFVSMKIDDESEASDLRAVVKGKVLFITKTMTYTESKRRFDEREAWITFNGLDTLASRNESLSVMSGSADVRRIHAVAKEYAAMAKDLEHRVDRKLKELGLDRNSTKRLTLAHINRICESGLVVELLLLPYAGLRDYLEAARRQP
ncbi:hypothetical protein MMC24_001923 [Lignoscripta atroalba]|nr:hypothetical protein [Lignoscripta atroalba]